MSLRNALWLAVVGALAVPTSASAAARVAPIPYSQRNPALPHPVHEGAKVTLKAVIREASCGTYNIRWDVDGDDNFDEEAGYNAGRNGTTGWVHDIGRTYEVGAVDRDTPLNINVRARPVNCAGQPDLFGTYRMFVYDWRPSNDPRNWTHEQLEIMATMAAGETLWYLFRTQQSLNRTDKAMWASSTYNYATGLEAWVFAINGHLPAYRPGTPLDGPLPDGFQASNDARWNADPYAETVMRFVNFMARGGGIRGIAGGEEANTCGWANGNNERQCNRIPGTADNRGVFLGENSGVYANGLFLGGMAAQLAALDGTKVMADKGDLRGQTYEWVVQQMVDKVGYQQIDGGCGNGGWLYGDFNGAGSCGHSDGSTSQWSYIGLEAAEVSGGRFGVFVNNRHKYRIADNLVRNQRGDGGAGYRSNSGRGDTKLTGGALVGSRWLGIHTFNRNSGQDIFRQYSDFSEGRLRQAYDTYLSYLSRVWTEALSVGSHWQDSIWRLGDYTCGNRNRIYNDNNDNNLRCGSSYAMYSLQKGFRTGQPELEQVGNHDWFKEFTTYYVRAQDRNTNDYGNFGRIYDSYCDSHSVTCSYGGGRLAAPMGNLVLTPTIFNPKPIAIGEARPAETTEGCAGGNNGRVTFDHSASFHPSDSSRIIAWQWDIDASNGLWWETGANPDFQTGGADAVNSWTYTYLRAGDYTATLRVVDNVGQSKETTVDVRVNEAQNVPPSAAHGGPYVIEINSALALRGSGTDGNLDCGDRITIAWDLDNDGQFDDANGAQPTVNWGPLLAGLPVGQPNRIRIQVRDEAGEVATAETTLTIFPREPVARGRANPNPAGCPQTVTFDGSASFHPSPARSIASYRWDVDGNDGFDGEGAVFRFDYDTYGTYRITLRVTDDLGRFNETEFDLEVNQGNAPPVARASSNRYVVLEGDALNLDARASSDANIACGDRIAAYEWDIDGNGNFGDAVDVQGAQAQVPWNTVRQVMEWPADRDSGLPSNTIRLRVTDSFGQSHTIEVQVVVFAAAPIAVVSQSPNPSPINLVNGFSTTTLDARESRSPVPGVDIARYQWDTDGDGDFNDLPERSVVDFVKVFDPVPGPNNIPDVRVRLRVTDGDGRVGEVEYRIIYRVPPTPPTADADPTDPPEVGYHILLGEGLRLDGTQSFDPDEDEFGDFIQFYRWDLTYQAGNFAADFEEEAQNADDADAARIDLTAQQLAAAGVNAVGRYTVAIEVEDTTDLSNIDTAPLNVYAVNPVADARANPNPAACGARVTFDGSASNHPHPAIDIAAYAWDLDGDGQYDDAQGAAVTHRFDQFSFGEPFHVGLQVTDSRDHTGTATVDVTVDQGNRSPTAEAGGFRDGNNVVQGPYVIALGENLQLDATGSVEPDTSCGDRIEQYRWDVGNDGTFDLQVNAVRPPVLTAQDLAALGIDQAGDYEVHLVVTDRFGVTGEDIATLRVVNGPVARASADPARAGCQAQVNFDASASSTDGPANQGFAIESYEWDLDGDGQYDDAAGIQVSRAVAGLPDQNGRIRFRAGLRITDASGRTSTTEVVVEIDVQNLPPTADAGGPYSTGPIGGGFAAVRLDGRSSSDPNEPCDEIVTYKWDTDNDGRFGADDNPPDLVGATVNYTNPNWRVNTTQVVRLVVCDANDVCSQPAGADINVLEEAPPTGEVVSPRADDGLCIPGGNRDVVVTVADPEGDVVTVTIEINNAVVGQRQVDTPNDGSPQEVTIAINANLVAEGNHEIIAHFEDGNGGESQATSGGRILFDRTAPEVNIGQQPAANVCYNRNQVPVADPEVVDNLDANPSLSSETVEDGCGRTLRITATDACGNEGTAERTYLIAQPTELTINGARENELVAEARLSWEVVGPAGCGNDISARLSRDGGAAQPYPMNQLVNAPGTYSLNVTATNCQGVEASFIRNFRVNTPPVAVPIPDGYPAADPDNANAYVVAEGAGLQLDGSESRPPEQEDEIAQYDWDFDGDGQVDAQGAVVDFPTDVNGVFNGRLTVTDGLGATHQADFRVTVTDVSPVASAGGPYEVDQGVALEFDGSGSRAGSPADAITEYRWDFDGDGQDDFVASQAQGNLADGQRPSHTYDRHGAVVARLTVCDEDNCTQVEVRVAVADVDPQIAGIDVPDDPYEIRPMTFTVRVTPGAASDPITRYEWDCDNDGEVDQGAAGANLATWNCRFRTEGRKTVTVRVRDIDSNSVFAVNVDVRRITLGELIDWIGERIAVVIDPQNGAYSLQQKFKLAGSDALVAQGLWGEDFQHRGTSLLATDRLLVKLRQAQSAQVDFGIELWALSRTLKRDNEDLRQQILDLDNGPAADHPSLVRAEEFIQDTADRFDADDFEADARSEQRHQVVSDLFADAFEAYFWLQDSIASYNTRNRYALPPNRDPVAVSAAGDEINAEIANILEELQAEMQDYIQDGGAERPGPARAEIAEVIQTLSALRDLQSFRVINPCPDGERCVTDNEALQLELLAMDLVRQLDAAAIRSAYARIWQQHLVLLLKFRLELSILRVEFVCGANSRYSLLARERQETGLRLVDENRPLDALAFYVDDETRCLMIDVYNGCLSPQDAEENPPVVVPAACEQ